MWDVRKSIWQAKEGAAAIEFSILAFPFFIAVFGILDVAMMFFIDGSLDSALHMAAREVRTGQSAKEKWDIVRFKKEVCDGMALSFSCQENLLVMTKVMSDFSTVTFTSPISGGTLNVKESFANGVPSDYVLIQAFLPWPSWLAPLGIDTAHLPDGRYVLSASALFRNEPFEN